MKPHFQQFKRSFAWIAGVTMAYSPLAGMAQEPNNALKDTTKFVTDGLKITASEAGYNAPKGIPTMVGDTIEVLLGMIGIIFLILLLYAGFLYLTAGGEGDKVKKAKQLISNAVIGIVIVVAAYALTRFVVALLIQAAS